MSQERWVNGVRWGSYYAPPALEQIEAFETQAGIKLPKAMVQLYQVGDGPFVKQAGDEVAAYHFETSIFALGGISARRSTSIRWSSMGYQGLCNGVPRPLQGSWAASS
jgi:hypothetical protein